MAPVLDLGLGLALGGPGEVVVQAVETTSAGPVVVGDFTGTFDFDPGVQERTSAGGRDIFIADYDRLGSLLWLHAIGGPGDGQANAIDVGFESNGCSDGIYFYYN